MSIESALHAIAEAIHALAKAHTTHTDPARPTVAQIDAAPPQIVRKVKAAVGTVCMDEAGVPTTFKRRCGICGELGRYRSSHRDEMRNGTFHWVEVKE